MNTMRLFMILMCSALVVGPVMLSPGVGVAGPTTIEGDHLVLTAMVSRIQSDVVFVKMPWGQLPVGTTKRLPNVQVGDRLRIALNEDNAVIDVHKTEEPAQGHARLMGHAIAVLPAKGEIHLWTTDGKTSLTVREPAVVRLTAIPEGAPVIVEINEAGEVIDIQKAFVSVQIEGATPNA